VIFAGLKQAGEMIFSELGGGPGNSYSTAQLKGRPDGLIAASASDRTEAAVKLKVGTS
jgi:hypothetical protein